MPFEQRREQRSYPQSDWQSVETMPALPADELQVWRINLPTRETTRIPDAEPEAYLRHLTFDERSRAGRLRTGHVRLEFVVARASLRILLGGLLALPPEKVPISTGSHGKPQTPGIHFNLAHSAGIILIALSRSSQVGIDVEAVDRQVEATEIAQRNFSPEEFRALEAVLNPDHRQQAFFRLWTRKEAIIKADGRGLSLPLQSFTVPISPDVFSVPIQVDATTLLLSDLRVAATHAAAVAVKEQLKLRLFSLPLASASS